jgi:hypothetical protein
MSEPAWDLDALAARASGPAVELARLVLVQDLADGQWAAQIGPALSQSDTARLLGKSEQAVSKDARLLRVRNRDGRPVYPVVQFNGRSQLPGLGEVVMVLASSLLPLTVASWLTATNPALGQRRPVDVLAGGDLGAVLAVARRLAAASA